MSINVVNEARRCLNCKVPLCRKGCPINTNVPAMNQMFLHNQKDEAGQMLFTNNPLSAICSLVCNHEKQCEGHCIIGKTGALVGISSIENYISDAYLDHMNLVCEPSRGQRVAIIGAGNSAMDVARTVLRKGTRSVTVFCRRSHAAANVREVEYAVADGVEMRYGCYPVEITDEGVIIQQAQLDEQDNVLSMGEPELFRCSSVIVAVSQGALNRIVSSTHGINTSEKGLLTVNEQGSTSRAGIFAGGDVVTGARTVVEAVRYSKDVADAMDKYLRSL